jgi:hypothetical protein
MLRENMVFKETVPPRLFASGFFHESYSPEPLTVQITPFRFFSEFADIFAGPGGRCTIRVNYTGGKLTTGVVDTGGKFANLAQVVTSFPRLFVTNGVVDIGGKLPLVQFYFLFYLL